MISTPVLKSNNEIIPKDHSPDLANIFISKILRPYRSIFIGEHFATVAAERIPRPLSSVLESYYRILPAWKCLILKYHLLWHVISGTIQNF